MMVLKLAADTSGQCLSPGTFLGNGPVFTESQHLATYPRLIVLQQQ